MKTRSTPTFRPGSSRARSSLRFAFHPLSLAICLAVSNAAVALPQGGSVVAGSATISQPTPTSQTITQTTQRAIIDWHSFSIAAGEQVRFNQPSSSAVTLNRVTGFDPSYILGRMSSNGRVFLLNPYGVVFGAGARIDVGGMVASSLSLADNDFLAGRYSLTSGEAGAPAQRGAVRNEGVITAPGGTVVLAAPVVSNTGSIVADGGRVGLVAAQRVSVDVEGDGLIFFQASSADAQSRLEQLGRIQADGGTVELRAAARGAFADTVLNMAGVVQARTLGAREGRVVIDGGGDGIVSIAGRIDASGAGASTHGGSVDVLGQRILLDNGARIDASGGSGGGTIRVGGDLHGANPALHNAEAVIVAPDAVLRADAISAGDGGKVVVWADGSTRFYGAISAQGGAVSGNGGAAEVSGKEALTFAGSVDLRAAAGNRGTLLLDPKNITISAGGIDPVVGNLAFTDNPTLPADISAAVLVAQLSLSDVRLQANNDILVRTDVTVAGAGTAGRALELDAGRHLIFATTPDLVTPSSSTGAVTVTMNGGPLTLRYNDQNAVAVNRDAGAAQLFMATGSSVVTAGGAFTVTRGTQGASAGVTLRGVDTRGGANAAGGAVSVTVGNADAIVAGAIVSSGGTAGAGAGRAAGNVTLTSALGNVTVGAITARGSNAFAASAAAGGAGGAVALSAGGTLVVNGSIATAGGAGDGAGARGAGRSISLTGAGVTVAAGLVLDADDSTIAVDGNAGAIQLNTATLTTTSNAASAITIRHASTVGLGSVATGATGTTTLGVAGDITGAVTQAGTIVTGTLAGSTAGTTTLAGANNVAHLGPFASTGGDFTLNDGGHALDIAGALDAGGHAVTLTATSIGQNVAGIVTTATLTATATAGIDLSTATNAVSALGATSTGGGNFALVNGATALTVGGALSAGAGAVSLTSDLGISQTAAGVIDTSGTLTLTAGGAIDLGSAANSIGSLGTVTRGGAFTLADTTGGLTLAGSVSAGTTSNAVAITTAGGALVLGSHDIVATGAGGNVTLAGVGVTQAGGIVAAGGTTSIAAGAGAITLASVGNDFGGAVGLANSGANDVALSTANGLVLGASNVGSGTLALTAGGNVSQTGALTQAAAAGAVTVTVAGTGVDVRLDTQANNLSGAVSFAGGTYHDIGLRNVNAGASLPTLPAGLHDLSVAFDNAALSLPATSLSGNLAVSAGGAVTQSGALTVAGTTSVSAGGHAITLTQANDFQGAVSLANSGANNVAVTDINGLVLGTSTLGSGTLGLSTGGNVTQSGAVSQAAAAGAVTITVAGAGVDALLDTQANNFSGGVSFAGGTYRDIGLRNDNGGATLPSLPSGLHDLSVAFANASLSLPATSLSGNLVASAGGAVTQSGALSVAGTSNITAGAAIALTNPANDFGGAVSLAGGATQITDANALVLGALATGALTVDNTGALVLGSGSAAAIVAASHGGAVSQSGALVVAGTTAVNAGAGAITLTAANDFQGAVGLVGATTQINDANALALSTFTTGALTVASSGALALGSGAASSLVAISNGGAVTQAGALAIAGTTSVNAGGGTIALTQATNDFVGAVSLSGGTTTIVDANALTLGTLATGALSATASGALVLGSGSAGALAATSNGGAISQSGPLAVAGASSVNAGAGTITLADLGNNFVGAVALTGAATQITDANALTLGALATGALTVNSTGALGLGSGTAASIAANSHGGAVSQSGALAVAGTTAIDAGTGTITLAAAANNFVGSVGLIGAATQVTDANALALGTIATGALTVDSTGALDLGTGSAASIAANSHGGAVTQSGALVVAGTTTVNAGAASITLTRAGNDFGGAVGVTTAGLNDATIVDANDIVLGASSVGRNLAVTSHGNIGQTGAIVVAGTSTFTVDTATGRNVLLAGRDNDFTGAVTIATSGGATLNDVGLRNVGLAAALPILSLTGLRDLDLQFANTSIVVPTVTLSGALNVVAGGSIGQAAGGVRVAGTSTFAAGAHAVTLTDAANDFGGAVGVSNSGANNVALRDANALVLGASNVGSGTFAATAGGAITQTGAIVQAPAAGAATFLAGANAITLANASNDFTGAVSFNGAATRITDANALTLGSFGTGALTIDSTGALNLGSGSAGSIAANSHGGAVSQTGALVVAGTTTIAAGAGSITLTTATNDFGGAVGVSNSGAADVALRDANALVLGASSVGSGALSVTANGPITQAGAIVQAAAAGSATFAAGANAITLTNAGNDFTGAVRLTGSTTQITDANALALSTFTTGALTIDSSGALALGTGSANSLVARSNGGAVTQSGALVIAGTTAIDAGTGAITLGNAANDFTGAVSLTGGTTAITDANALTLGTLATGALTASSTGALGLGSGSAASLLATSNGGAVSQAGPLAVAGTTTIAAGTGAVTLTNAGNDFGSVAVTGGAVSLVDANALTLTSLTSAPNQAVTVIAGGTLTLPASPIDSGSAALTLTSGGTLATVGTLRGGNVALASAGAMTLGADVTSLGTLSLATTNASISQSGGRIAAAGTTTVSAGSGDITLARPANDFVGAVSLSGGAVDVRDVNDLAVSALASAPNRAVSLVAGNNLVLPSAAIDTGSAALTLQALAGTLVINGPLSGGTVTLTGGAGLALGADVTTSGDQIYTTAVQIAANVTLDAGASRIDLQGGANGGGNNLGLVSSNGAADAIRTGGAITNVGQLTVTGNATLGAAVTTTGNQSYTGPLTLAADVALNSGAARIDLLAAVDAGGHALALTSSNAAADAIRARATIDNTSQLTVTGRSTLANGVTTSGAQLYTDTLTLGASSTFTGTGLGFGNGIAAAGFDLGLRSDTLTLAGTVTGTGTATLSPLGQGASLGIAGGAGSYQLSQATLDRFGGLAGIVVGRADGSGDLAFGNLVLAANLAVQSGSGNVAFNGTVTSAAGAARDLAVATGGVTRFAATVGGAIGGPSALGNLGVAGTSILAADIATAGTQTFAGNASFGANSTLSGGSVAFGGGLDLGGHAVTVLADAVAVAGPATGAVGASLRLAPRTASGSVGVAGGAAGAGALQVSQSLIDTLAGIPSLTLGRADGTGTIAVGALVLPTDLAITAGSGDVVFAGSVDSAAGPARDLRVTTTGITSLSGTVGATRALDTLLIDGASRIGAAVTTSGAQTYGGAVGLAADSTLAGPSVSFASSVDGAHALVVDAVATTFASPVGATVALASLSTDAVGTTRIGGNVSTSGAQRYGDALVLDASATLAGSMLNLAGSVDGGHALTLNGSTGVTLGGAVGSNAALTALSVAGPLQFGAGAVTTTGAQSYGGVVALTRDTTLTAPGIAFASSVDGAFGLALQSAGTTSFGASVGALDALASLTAVGGGTVQLAGSTIQTVGAQNYAGALQLAGSTRLTGNALALGGAVSGAADLQLQTNALTGAASLAGTGTLTVSSLDPALSIGIAGGAGTLQVSQATLNGATGFTSHVIGRADGSGAMTSGPLVLRADTTLRSGSGDINVGGSVDGAFALALETGATTRIAGPIGITTPLRSIVTDNAAAAPDWNGSTGERTLFDSADGSGQARVVTTGAQTFNDPIVATVPLSLSGTAITASQPANRFDGAVSVSAGSLQLRASGDLTLGNVELATGGAVEADGVLRFGGALQLNGGTLVLTSNATPTAVALTDPDLQGRPVSFGFVPIQEAIATISQNEGATLHSAAGSALVFRSPQGGTIQLDQPGNTLLGTISAVSGTLGDNDVRRFTEASAITLGFVRIASSEIHVAGRQPADGNQSVAAAGIEGDAIKLTADVLTTGSDGVIRARLPYNNVQGSQTSVAGITFVLSPTALAQGGGFGSGASGDFIQVQVGGAEGGFVTARPRGVGGDTAVIFLGGSVDVRPFYDNNGRITEIRIFYNGDAPRTPQEAGALAAVIALIEEARHARFEEAVRTENVSARLRSGVIAEVGAGRPATVGRESIRLPESCEVKTGTLRCE